MNGKWNGHRHRSLGNSKGGHSVTAFLLEVCMSGICQKYIGIPLSDVSQTVSEVSSYIFRPPGPKPPIRHQLLMFLQFGCGLLLAFYFCFSEAAWQLEDVLHDVNIEVYPDKPRSSGQLNHADSTKMWFDGGKLKRVLTCGESLRLNLEPILMFWNMFFLSCVDEE